MTTARTRPGSTNCSPSHLDGPDAFAQTPQQLLDVAFSHPPNFALNTEYQHSNTNPVLLALVVEKVSGLPFGEQLRQNIFAPTGLTHTSYPGNGVLPEPHLHGYLALPAGPVVDATFWKPSWADAAGRIVSTTDDLKVWARTLGTAALLNLRPRRNDWPTPALPRPVPDTASQSLIPTGGSATTATSPATPPCWPIFPNTMRRCRFRSTPMCEGLCRRPDRQGRHRDRHTGSPLRSRERLTVTTGVPGSWCAAACEVVGNSLPHPAPSR